MDIYYTNIVLKIDVILLSLSLLLAIFIVISSAIRDIRTGIRRRRLAAIMANLQNLPRSAGDNIIQACSVLVKDINPSDFLEVAKRKDTILPKDFEGQINECLNSPAKAGAIEKIAGKSRKKWRRIEAILIAGYINSSNALDIIKKALQSRDDDVVYFSILSLGYIKTAESARVLIDLLRSRPYMGHKIASVLETFPSQLLDGLVAMLNDPDPSIRFWIIKVISRSKEKLYAVKIIPFTEDMSADIRAAACECLGELGDGSAKDALKKRLKDESWFVRMHAVRALEKLLRGNSLVYIAELLFDANQNIRNAVKTVMINNIEGALPYIERFLESPERGLGIYCVEILEESHYIEKMFVDICCGYEEIKSHAIALLEKILSAGAHIGLEAILIRKFTADEIKIILGKIAGMDPKISEHIKMFMKGEIVHL